jgi:hypothetical protein
VKKSWMILICSRYSQGLRVLKGILFLAPDVRLMFRKAGVNRPSGADPPVGIALSEGWHRGLNEADGVRVSSDLGNGPGQAARWPSPR